MYAFCIMFSENFEDIELGELTNERTVASVPFGGRYRLVDFMLSSLVGAHIRDIGIISRNKYGSLMEHIGWGKDWDLNRKNGGIKFLTPFLKKTSKNVNSSEIETLYSTMDYIKNALPEYAVLCDANIIANIDFKELIRYHKYKNADITFAYKTSEKCEKELEVSFNSDDWLTDSFYHQINASGEKNIALNIMVLKKDLLISLIERGVTYGWTSLKMNVLAHNASNLKICGYKVTGYSAVIKTCEEFFKANMDLLSKDVRMQLFFSKNPVLTRIKDSVPVFYGKNANVTNSLIADGAAINGTVENSIIFRDVRIKKGAIVKNSIIMQGTIVEEDAILSGVITDMEVVIGSSRMLAGTENMPFIINKGKLV